VPIFLSNLEIARLIRMPDALEAVEDALLAHHRGSATNLTRQRFRVPKGVFRAMSGALPSRGVMGTKAGIQNFEFAAGVTKESVQVLYSTDTGELLALFWSDLITDYRTGAAGGVSIKYLARRDASIVAVLGSGRQARTQLLAAALCRPLAEARVYSPTAERRESFAAQMSETLGLPVRAVANAREAVEPADIVLTATSASRPVFDGAWLSPGCHVVSIRSSYRRDVATGRERRELDDATVARAAVLAVDSIEQARAQDSPEVGAALDDGRVSELGAIMAGAAEGRKSAHQVSLFKCFGMGLLDVALAERVYRRALEAGIGLPISAAL